AYELLYKDFRRKKTKCGHVGAERRIKKFMDSPDLIKEGKRILNERISRNLETCGILCLSETLYNILLWSHYSNGHTGYCVAFYKEKLLEFSKDLGTLKQVKYQISYPSLPFWGGDNLNKVLKIVFTKSKLWKYENEWRFFIPNIEDRKFKIPVDCIYAIYLGSRITKEDTTDIINCINRTKNKISVFKMNISNSKYAILKHPIPLG
ncbi:MAG: DUF2971 domain-containing protein, partial [archaeon]|nr:DUF2971 domain-containing protein [archaeon]